MASFIPVRPQQVVISYFQGGKIVDYITEKYGWDTILAMLKDFGNSERHAGGDPQGIEDRARGVRSSSFWRISKPRPRTCVARFDDWKKQVKGVVDAVQEKDWDAAIKDGTAIRDYYPDYVEDHSIYELLAQAYEAKGDKKAAIGELEAYVKAGGRNPESIKKAGEASGGGRQQEGSRGRPGAA